LEPLKKLPFSIAIVALASVMVLAAVPPASDPVKDRAPLATSTFCAPNI
jgi:hypothetical protein